MGERVRHVGVAISGFVLLLGCVFGAPTPTFGLRVEQAPGGTGPWELVVQEVAPVAATPVQVDTGRPRPEHPAEPSQAVDCRIDKCVALTFDDGPSEDTARLLDLLTTTGVPATFFMLGHQVAEHRDLARVTAGGAEIGSHGWAHRSLLELTDSQIGNEVLRTDNEVAGTIGRRPTLFRPPYGAVDESARAVLRRAGLPIVLWSVDPQDWRIRNADAIHDRVMEAVRPGSVVLLHDIHPTTVDAVPRIIADLRAQGFVFVTVSQMWDGHLSPGEMYTGRESDWQGAANATG